MTRVIKSKSSMRKLPEQGTDKDAGSASSVVTPNSPLSDEAMARLAKIMNDSPTIIKLQGTEREVKALKPGTQWLIAEEAC